MRPKIEIRYPDGRAETITLTRERTVIGRSPSADIRVNDNRVSREHCVIELDGNRLYVTDLGGSNGTWVGSAKLLANVREPFPQEAVLHVGPAQLRNVTARPDPANDLESQAFNPVAPSRDSGRAAASPPPRLIEASRGLRPSTWSLEKRSISLNAGERGSLLLHVSNQSKIVDHYTLSVSGVPTTWVTLPRAGH
jgi:pSer/pThr/pTyr-binding forkhead associated (FHA) protein